MPRDSLQRRSARGRTAGGRAPANGAPAPRPGEAPPCAEAASPAEARLRGALTALLVLQALGAFLPGPLLWGVNHLAYAPLPLRLLWPLAGLAWIWTPAGTRLGAFLSDRIGRGLLGRPFAAFVVAPVAGAALLWVARARVPCLGDGWLLGELVARGHGFHGYDWIAFYMHAKLFQVLGLQGEPAAFALFGAVSVGAGALYLSAAAWAARGLAAGPASRALVYTLLILCAPLQMFMGYVECYALLLVAMLVFLVALVRHARGELPLAAPAAALGVGLFLHLDALFLAPLLAAVVVWPPSGLRPDGRRLLIAAGLPLAGLALAAGVHLLEGSGPSWFAREIFHRPPDRTLLMPFLGAPGLLSLVHAKDVVNLLLLLAAVPLAMGIAAAPRRPAAGGGRPTAAPTGARLMLLGSAWIVLLAVVLDMVLGMPRDWDLLAAQAPVFVLAALLIWIPPARPEPRPRGVGMIAATACALALPWFWLNAGTERALTRFADVLGGQSAYAQAYAHEEIGKHHRKLGDHARAIEEYRRTIRLFPGNPRFHALLGALLYNTGEKNAAFEAFQQTLAVDREYPLALEMLARLHAERDEPQQAIEYARRLAGRGQESADAAELHGLVAERLDLSGEAMAAYQRASEKDPTRVDVLERLGALGFLTGDAAVSEQAYRRILQRLPRSVTARQGLVLALWGRLREDPDRWRTAEGRRAMEEALGWIDSLLRDGQGGEAGEMVAAWQREIRSALQVSGGLPAPGARP